jgi:hypothetical protein
MRNLSYFGTVNPESKKCYNLTAANALNLKPGAATARTNKVCSRFRKAGAGTRNCKGSRCQLTSRRNS